jgi:hypothetical protein
MPKEDVILAYGEVTGHMHKLSGTAEVYRDAEASYFRGEHVSVVHDEHDKVSFPKNAWIKVIRQREYDPLAAEKERKVAD